MKDNIEHFLFLDLLRLSAFWASLRPFFGKLALLPGHGAAP
ncbi:hypothetical protein N0824_00050 [Microcystis sp. 0824]|nr:hypothetical protein N0824_00050 [Microcystis sp. 0824]